jgi:hypothetical protein
VKKLIAALVIAATPAAAADADRFANVHTVAIRSELGDGLTLIQNADLGGATAPETVLQSGADIDGLVVGKIRAAVAGRFTVVDPSAAPDAIIVVRASEIAQHLDLPQFSASFQYSGLSATRTEGWFGAHSILLSAQFAISVVDTRSGTEIAYGQAKGPATGIFGNRPDPIEKCDDGFWPASVEAPTPDEVQQMRADLTAIIAMALPNALVNAGLSTQGNDIKLDAWNGHALACHEFG